jgi:hypothetical protein
VNAVSSARPTVRGVVVEVYARGPAARLTGRTRPACSRIRAVAYAVVR